MKTRKYRIIIRNIHPDGAAVHDIVRQELGKVEIVDWRKEGEVNFQGECGSGPQRHVYVVVKYREVPKKTKGKITGKKPAHEAVVDEIKLSAEIFIRDGKGMFEPGSHERLGAARRILENMIIPEDQVQLIVNDLRQFKKDIREKYKCGHNIDGILPESFLTAIESQE